MKLVRLVTQTNDFRHHWAITVCLNSSDRNCFCGWKGQIFTVYYLSDYSSNSSEINTDLIEKIGFEKILQRKVVVSFIGGENLSASGILVKMKQS